MAWLWDTFGEVIVGMAVYATIAAICWAGAVLAGDEQP